MVPTKSRLLERILADLKFGEGWGVFAPVARTGQSSS